MKRSTAAALLINILCIVFAVAFYSDMRTVCRELEAAQKVGEERIKQLESKQQQEYEELRESQIKLDAHVQYFITGGWK